MSALSKESIASEALAFIDELGEPALSMRSLSKRMGVGPMSLYTYYPSREEMVCAALAKVVEEADGAPVPGETWEETILRTTSSIRAVALRHKKAFLAALPREAVLEPHLRRLFAMHSDQGIPLEIYKQMYSVLAAFMFGFLEQELAHDEAEKAIDAANKEDWQQLFDDAYNETNFTNGVKLIILGVKFVAPEEHASWVTPTDESLWTWE